MEGTDISNNVDYSSFHDHTYYGNGCTNTWDTTKPDDGYGGSKYACSTRIVKTADNESLVNGAYYSFMAASSGSGTSEITALNSNTPDSFCPLGWQLPYSGTGGDYYDKSKSWRYLYTLYSISYNTGNPASSATIRSYPFSYIFSGEMIGYTSRLFKQDREGSYWSPTVYDLNSSFRMHVWANGDRTDEANSKSGYYNIRCDFEISNLKAPHGIRVHSLVLWLFIF